jgi:hypothetical protein
VKPQPGSRPPVFVHFFPLSRFLSLFRPPVWGRFRWVPLFLGFAVFRVLPFAAAQEDMDWDFDTLFDEPEEGSRDSPEGEVSGASGSGASGLGTSGQGELGAGDSGGLLADLLGRAGFSLDLSYSANAGFSPGWSEAPWFAAAHEPVYSHVLGVNLTNYINMDVRVSDTFRVHNSLSFSVPGSSAIAFPEFFVDYQVLNRVFFRVGKFGHSWGISPNFSAANLLSRVPAGKGGDSYIFKTDIPVGVGGLELLALTRSGFMQGATPAFREIGYGAKYNLAFTWADIDLGAFYHREMPLRAFASVKTTVADTELYVETMGAVRHETWDGFSFSANLGFARSFFDDLVSLNGELFWNGEDDVYYFKPGTELEDERTSPFIPGLNAAWNLVFRPGWIWNLRFAVTGRWALDTNTAYILPGLSFAPLPHIDVSLGFPLALGGREGRYYSRDAARPSFAGNADTRDRPFAFVLLLNLHGGYHLDRY